MPNEQINYPKWRDAPEMVHLSPSPGPGPVSRLEPVVQVGWAAATGSEEGTVQLTMTKLDDVLTSQLGADGKPKKWPKSDERQVTLSRTEINKLIRTLRRARDQAFGQDE
jgi:hypothetical protein